MSNTKRNDVDDIMQIIKRLDDQGIYITSKSIANELKQTPANVHRILTLFNIDLKPYKAKFKNNKQAQKNITDNAYLSKMKGLETYKHTVDELIKVAEFKGTEKEFKKFLREHNIVFKTKSWFVNLLNDIPTKQHTLKELYDLCELTDDEVSLSTFRTRLYDNGVPYKKVNNYSRKQTSVPHNAMADLTKFFQENEIETAGYTIRELYGNFDFDLSFNNFRLLLKRQGIKTKENFIIRIK